MLKSLCKKYLNAETTSYLIFGVLTTIVNYLVFTILNIAGVNIVLNNSIAWLIAVIFAYITNKKYVFKNDDYSRNNIIHEFAGFVGARIISFLFETIFLLFTVKFLRFNPYVAKIIASIGVIIINYIASKFFIFNKAEEGTTKESFIKKLKLIDPAYTLGGNITYVVAFLLPIIILSIIYCGRDFFPFGEECYLRSDMYHQYAPFYSELWYKLSTGGSLKYSWDIGLGTNFIALAAYYLSSPFNWFIVLFPQKSMIEIMLGLITIKMALSSVTFTYYISKHFNTKHISIACIGIFYGLSGYLAAYSWNIMWLDCILLFPLIVLGLEKLIKEDKYILYTVSLGLCILSNYYISIMVCLSLILLFIYNIIVLPNQKHIYVYLKKAFNFALFSLIAGGLAAILLLPEIYAFKLSGSNDFDFPKTLECYFPVLEIMVRHLPNITVHLGLDHFPNIYCGSFVFFLLPLYWFNPKKSTKNKIGKTFILAILLTSFNMNIPNYIWHGLHFPNFLPARQGFIYVFILLTMCFEAMHNIGEYTKNQIIGAFAAAIAFLIIAEQMYSGDTYSFKSFYIAAVFLMLYLIIALLVRYTKFSPYVSIVMLIVICGFECGMNMEKTGLATTNRTSYLANNDAMDKIKETLKEEDDSFYRVEFFYNYRSKNDTAWHNMKGVSTFSSTANEGMTTLLTQLGMECSFNAYSSHDATALTSALLNIKYQISAFSRVEGTDISFFSSSDNLYVYKNNLTLPVAYLVDPDINKNWSIEGDNPFDIQNRFIYNNTGIDDVFYHMNTSKEDTLLWIYPEVTCHAYLYCPIPTDTVINVVVNGFSREYGNLNETKLIDIGYVSPGDEVYITDCPQYIEIYTYDENNFITAFNTLNDSSLNVTSYDDTHIEGTLNAAYDGAVMCAIPYETGWKVYVDGKKVSTFAIKDALLGFNVPAGEHDIKLSYSPAGFTTGTIITLFSLLIFILIIVFDKKTEKKKIIMEERNELL